MSAPSKTLPILTCEQCGKDSRNASFEMVIAGRLYYFCTLKCMSEYAKENL